MGLGRGFAAGFLQGAQAGNAIISAYRGGQDRAKQEALQTELTGAVNAKPVESQGFTQEQGQQLSAAADSGQYDIGYDQAKQGYTVTPKAGGEAGVVAQQGVSELLGQRKAGTFSDTEINAARNSAVVNAIKKSDPIRGFGLEQSLRQQEREDKRFGFEEKRAERADRKDAKEEEYQNSLPDLYNGLTYTQQHKQFQESQAAFETANAKYEADKAAGTRVGAPPVKPVRGEYSAGDAVLDRAKLLEHSAKFGKVDQRAFTEFTDMLKKVESEGYLKTLKIAQAGGSLQEIAKAFNSGGSEQFDPASVISDNFVKGKDGVGSRVIRYKKVDGTEGSINSKAELDSLGEADKLYTRVYQANADQRGANADARGARAEGRAQSEFLRGKTERDAKSAAATGLFAEQNPGATPAQLAAVKAGVLPATPSAKDYKVEYGEVAQAFGQPAVGADGKPAIDPLTGRAIVNRDIEQEKAFFKWMRDNGIKDTNQGLALYVGQQGGGASTGATASPKTKADFDKLPSGAVYVDPKDGKKYRKP